MPFFVSDPINRFVIDDNTRNRSARHVPHSLLSKHAMTMPIAN